MVTDTLLEKGHLLSLDLSYYRGIGPLLRRRTVAQREQHEGYVQPSWRLL